MKSLNQLKKYVPRHLRLGVCCEKPVITSLQEVVKEIPEVDDNGSVIKTVTVRSKVPAHVLMQKYRYESFTLEALVKSGVPLKVVNVNSSNAVTIDKLYQVCNSLDNAENFVNKVLAQQKERDSLFFNDVQSTNVES